VRATRREDHTFGLCDGYLAELALWERRWTDADAAAQDCLAQARRYEAPPARGVALPESWSEATDSWQRLERPPLVVYCRWRQAEALVAAGASRAEAAVPLREAHAAAARIEAKPLLLSSPSARLELTPPQAAFSTAKPGPLRRSAA
jgi:hypothetical protein